MVVLSDYRDQLDGLFIRTVDVDIGASPTTVNDEEVRGKNTMILKTQTVRQALNHLHAKRSSY